MSRFLNRRVLGLLGLVVTAQLLSACVVVPVPHHARRPVVIDVEPGYGHGHGHHHHRHRDRDYRH